MRIEQENRRNRNSDREQPLITTRRVLFLLSPNLCSVTLKFAIRCSKSTILAGGILLALCSLLLAPCSSVDAQQTKKIHRIGYLSPFEPALESGRSEAIRLALRELGYIEGQNIAIEYRYAEGKA
jgi:hypothetical protein